MKLLAAIVITIIVLAVISGIARLIEKTDGLIILLVIFAGIVAVVYANL